MESPQFRLVLIIGRQKEGRSGRGSPGNEARQTIL